MSPTSGNHRRSREQFRSRDLFQMSFAQAISLKKKECRAGAVDFVVDFDLAVF
jgi:hypothetical protein